MSHNNCHVVPIEKSVTIEEMENTQHLILMVQGMGCVNCAMRVRNSLFALKGVAQVEVSHFTAAANIRFNPDLVTLKRLFEAIASAGNDGVYIVQHGLDDLSFIRLAQDRPDDPAHFGLDPEFPSQVARHGVERPRQVLELVPASDLDAAVEIPPADAPGPFYAAGARGRGPPGTATTHLA